MSSWIIWRKFWLYFKKSFAHICIAIDFWEVMLFYALRKQYPNSKFSLIRIFQWLNKVKSLEDQNKLQIFHAVMNISSAIRDKGESQDVCYKNIKYGTFSEKQTFLTPWYAQARVRIRDKKCSLLGKFGVLCFRVHPL